MPPVPIDPVARPVESELPDINPLVIVEPTHGVEAMLGAGTLINGLTPPLLISVAPRGIAPPLRPNVALAPGVDSGEAVPADETTPNDGKEQPFEVDAEPVPPPSNDDVVPVDPDIALPAIPEEEEVVPMQLVLPNIGPMGVGPKPPGSIPVAPSGIPVGEPEMEPGIPSGDVSPILGIFVMLCVRPASQLKRTTTAAMNNRRIKTSSGLPPRRRSAHSKSGSCVAKLGSATPAVCSKLRRVAPACAVVCG
jgi:hypothetical protein